MTLDHPPGAAERGSRPLALLIVDDERELTEEIAEAARHRGYVTHVANSASEALRILELHGEIGVMLTDIRMPRVDGLQLSLEVMRGRPDRHALEIVIMTGHATLEDAIFALRAGAFDFIRKPFRFTDVFDVVSRAMGRALGRRMLSLQQAAPSRIAEPRNPGPVDESPPGAPLPTRESLISALMHEARTPLVPILGFSELLDSEAYGSDIREFARHIRAGAQHLQLLIGDLIMLARLEGGELALQPVSVTPEQMLRDVSVTLTPATELARVGIKTGPIGPGTFHADDAMLRRALTILAGIAIQCSGRDKTVTMTALPCESGIGFHIRSGTIFSTAEERASDPWHNVMQVSPLGIRLVVAIAELHGGSLILHKPDKASFDATLVMPALVCGAAVAPSSGQEAVTPGMPPEQAAANNQEG
ncbi:MAG: response regulator [Roseococcus sp.]